MAAFDGAGKPYRGPSFRAGIVILVVCLVAVAAIWLAYSDALNILAGGPAASSIPANAPLTQPTP